MIALDLTPTEEAQILTVARQTGLTLAEYVKKVLKEHLPSVQTAPPPLTEKKAATIAYLKQRIAEDATEDPEEIRKADAEVQELMENLDRNRIESGERPLFP